ncbi:MAG TPA: VOC family protein [Streptosporangiaceae bacterium]|nr:VOC family protein [Streptosporangiaceae bacterium]
MDDPRAYLDKAAAVGGRTLVPPTDPPVGYGKFATFTDPDGNAVGPWA